MKKIVGLALLCILPFLRGDSVRSDFEDIPRDEAFRQKPISQIYNSKDRPNLNKFLDESMRDNESNYYNRYFSENLRKQAKKLAGPINPEEMQDISLSAYLEMREAEEMFYKTGNIEYAKKSLACGEVTAMLSPNGYGPQSVSRAIELAKVLNVKN